MKISRKFIKIALIAGMVLLLSSACKKTSGYVKSEGMIWNTVYHVTFKGPENLKDSILPVLNEVGQSLSVFEKSSLVTSLNENTEVKADIHLITVYESSQKINKLSHGNFDPTVSPLVDAWGFGIGHAPNADTLALDSLLSFIGIGKTRLEGGNIIKDDIRTRFNFSAIAKGYGCDAVGDMLLRNGVTDYMVEIGGELALSGKSPSGGDWKIAVDVPQEGKQPGEETALILTLTDLGVATSGNYRNFRIENGKKTAHTISPVTGRPFFSEILSATVIAPTCMDADGLATACMAGTPDEARHLLKEAGVEGLLIFGDSLWISEGLKKFIKN